MNALDLANYYASIGDEKALEELKETIIKELMDKIEKDLIELRVKGWI